MVVETETRAGRDVSSIRRAFQRSKVRFSVLEAIAERDTTYCGEICRATGFSARDVAGVLRGNGDYTAKRSFIELGLVREAKDPRDKRLIRYDLSDYGRFVYNRLKPEFEAPEPPAESQKPFFKR